jgi:MFS family permease
MSPTESPKELGESPDAVYVLSSDDEETNKKEEQPYKNKLHGYFTRVDTTAVPDEGYAWVICFLSFWIHFFVLGISYIFGIFQQEYKNRYPEVSSLGIALIGSLTSAGIPLFAIPVGKWIDRFGHSLIGTIGGTLYIIAFALTAYSNSYWMLLLNQGLLLGLSLSFSYFPALSILSQWFVKRQGLATGIAVSGAGIGGLVLSPLIRFLISAIGLQSTMLLIGTVGGITIIVSSFFLKRRLAPQKRKARYMPVLKNTNFQILYVLSIIGTFGYFVPFFYVPTYAVRFGMSVSEGALLIGILNGGSAIGRIILGHASDRIGHINALLICMLVSGLSIFSWPLATQFSTLLIFVLVFGFFVGGYISIIPTVIVQLFGTDNIAGTLGLVYSGTVFGTMGGPPLAGLILDLTGKTEFLGVIMFAGSTMLFATVLMALIRYRVHRAKSTNSA